MDAPNSVSARAWNERQGGTLTFKQKYINAKEGERKRIERIDLKSLWAKALLRRLSITRELYALTLNLAIGFHYFFLNFINKKNAASSSINDACIFIVRRSRAVRFSISRNDSSSHQKPLSLIVSMKKSTNSGF